MPKVAGNNNNNNNAVRVKRRKQETPVWRKQEKGARNKGEAYHRKELRYKNVATGQLYLHRKEKMVEAKIGKRLLNCCRSSCFEKFTDGSIRQLCNAYRKTGNLRDQRMFIARFVSKENVTVKNRIIYTIPSKYAIAAYKPKAGLSLTSIKVCKSFFMAALQVGTRFLRYNLKHKIKNNGLEVEEDRRKASTAGRRFVPAKTIVSIVNFVRLKLETVPSHYRRKDSSREYVDNKVTISKLHKEWLKNLQRQKSAIQAVTYQEFRLLFHSNFPKVSFSKPKIDKCKVCLRNASMSATEKSQNQVKHEAHLKEKDAAREEKRLDKAAAQQSLKVPGGPTLAVLEFDFEKQLLTPRGFSFYRKLTTHNFTLLNLATSETICYMYEETEGSTGSVEVGSCLHHYLLNVLPDTVKHVIFYSDSTTGQGKNRFVPNAYFHSLRKVNAKRARLYGSKATRLEIIDHKFLIPGHTQMIVDSCHSLIERSSAKVGSITHPKDWRTVVKQAASNPAPFKIVELKYNNFLNFAQSPNYFDTLVDHQKLHITKFVSYRYKLNNAIHQLQARASFIRAKKQPKNQHERFDILLKAANMFTMDPQQAYLSPIPVNFDTKLDMLQYVADGVIPRKHLQYYLNLPSTSINGKEDGKKIEDKVNLINEKYISNQFNETDNDFMDTTVIDCANNLY